jgi:hypothetical protein
MQCKGCIHQAVCMHANEFNKLEEQFPITAYPFKVVITCSCYQEEKPVARYDLHSQLAHQSIGNEKA